MSIKYETDSRRVKPGQIFIALSGQKVDGHDYIEEAIKNGATKVIGSRDLKLAIPYEKVPDTQKYLEDKLQAEYSLLLNELDFLGVTGTNGKTTTCYLIYQILKLLNVEVAYMGTIGFYYQEEKIELDNTTPDIITFYNLVLNAKEKGCKTVVMEVSSHALDLKRILGVKFQVAGFTNLTQDHLDYHKTMEEYLQAKLKIIDYMADDAKIIVNKDDKASLRFKENYSHILTFGENKADYKILSFETTPNKTKINFSVEKKAYEVKINLTSEFNVYNYILALALVNNYDYSIEKILAITPKLYAPKGRCETYEVNNGYAVIDYAHTPDAVEKVITAYTKLKKAHLITLVGCGGDRDPIKRPIMGKIASDLSDYVIFTSDNPRTEDPHAILNDILKGVKKSNYEVETDRKIAIKKAIDLMQKDDILLLLGKGHENYQIIGQKKIHLDDSEEVLNYKS